MRVRGAERDGESTPEGWGGEAGAVARVTRGGRVVGHDTRCRFSPMRNDEPPVWGCAKWTTGRVDWALPHAQAEACGVHRGQQHGERELRHVLPPQRSVCGGGGQAPWVPSPCGGRPSGASPRGWCVRSPPYYGTAPPGSRAPATSRVGWQASPVCPHFASSAVARLAVTLTRLREGIDNTGVAPILQLQSFRLGCGHCVALT